MGIKRPKRVRETVECKQTHRARYARLRTRLGIERV